VESSRIQFAYKVYRRPFRCPVRTSQGTWEAREGIILRVESEDGRIAFGEIAPIDRFGTETLAGALAWCVNIGSRSDLVRLLDVPGRMPCCAAAVSAIVADLGSQSKVERASSASASEVAERTLPVVCLLPAGAAALEELPYGIDRGFTTFKLKIGAEDIDQEMTLIRRLIDLLPAGGQLRCDANGGLDARTAARWLTAAADWPVEFLEQPLPVDSVDDVLALAGDFPTSIALDESALTADDIKRWRDRGWPGAFVIKPGLAGDRDELLGEVLVEPERFVFSSALESSVGMNAGIRLAFAAGSTRALGYGVGAFFSEDGLGGGWELPEVTLAECAKFNPEEVWNRL